MHGSSALISLVLAEGGNTLIWTWDAGDLLLFKHAQDYVRLLTKNRTTAAFIAFGGFNVAAALGDADCGSGLLVQAPKLRHIVTAVGSSGTWRAWCARILGIDTGTVSDFDACCVRSLESELAGKPFKAAMHIDRNQVGAA